MQIRLDLTVPLLEFRGPGGKQFLEPMIFVTLYDISNKNYRVIYEFIEKCRNEFMQLIPENEKKEIRKNEQEKAMLKKNPKLPVMFSTKNMRSENSQNAE